MRLPVVRHSSGEPATVEDVFNRLLDWPRRTSWPSFWTLEEPAIDVYRQDGSIVVKAAMPEAKPEEIEASIDGNVLMLHREYQHETEEKDKEYFYKEQQHSSFTRQVELPATVDAAKATAELKDGMLTITAPVSGAAEKKIPIKA